MIALSNVLDDFVSLLDTQRTHIKNFPCLVFLCGGDKKTTNIRSKTFKYVEIHNPELFSKIKLAENFAEWTDKEFYTNLIDLEEHLAHVVSFVPIISESFGAVSELGSFVSNPKIIDKVKVYVLNEHSVANSYIALGPIKKLSDRDNEQVFTFEPGMDDLVVEEIYKDILERTKPKFQTEILQHDDPKHQILLICEFVRLLSIARVTEIQYLLKKFDISLELKEIKLFLKLCQKIGILEFKGVGSGKDTTLYLAENSNSNFTNFSFLPGVMRKRKDLLRWKVAFRDEIIKNDNYRRSLIKSLENEKVEK